jgi:hypothetical protein
MKSMIVIATFLVSMLIAGLLHVVATAGPDDPLPCRSNARSGLVSKVGDHVSGGRDRICQVGADTAVATVTKRVKSDSVAAVRHVLMLQKRQGNWTVIRDLHIQKCQPGRGHQTFSREPCL